jgi:hypothetical protein
MFDVYGREVISQKLTTSNPKLKTSNLFPGIYFVEIISDDGKRMIKKLIKE